MGVYFRGYSFSWIHSPCALGDFCSTISYVIILAVSIVSPAVAIPGNSVLDE